MSFSDKTLTCRDCGRPFEFTGGEQEFYASRGFTNEPSRCPECRATRKASGGSARSGGQSNTRDNGSYSDGGYGNSSSGGYSSGGSYGGGGGGRSSDRGGYSGSREQRQMYTATCSSCGKEAQVPFQPTSGKPVYCSDCFATQRSTRY
jgi:CxxC-x17-CxxC domain-containing protein